MEIARGRRFVLHSLHGPVIPLDRSVTPTRRESTSYWIGDTAYCHREVWTDYTGAAQGISDYTRRQRALLKLAEFEARYE
jgi:hypothetical protein